MIPAVISYADSDDLLYQAKNDTDFSMKVEELSEPLIGNESVEGENPAEDQLECYLLVVVDGELDLSGIKGVVEAVSNSFGLCVIRFDSGESANEAYVKIREMEHVESVEFDGGLSAGSSQMTAAGSETHHSWGVETIGADLYSEYVSGKDTDELIVAVADSGVELDHYYLESRLIQGYDFVRNDDIADDENGHGTHVTGIVVDCTLGVDDIQIMPVKVLDDKGKGKVSDMVNGLLYAADNGAEVINISVVGQHHSNYLDTAVENLLERGVVIVAAAGNEAQDVDESETCPAHIGGIITVGAVNEQLQIYRRSNYGSKIDVVAPGTNIQSAYLNNTVTSLSGTSMATPHVTASVALLMLNYGNLSNEEVGSLLKRSCRRFQDVTHFGNGLIDLRNLNTDISEQTIDLKTKSAQYTGKEFRPEINVSRNGEPLFTGEDYTVSYINNIKAGPATAVIRGAGAYCGEKKVSFSILPKGTSIKKYAGKRKAVKLTWKKQTVQTSGYQIQYSTSKTFKNAKKVTVKSNKSTSRTISKLKAKKKYYFRIRTFKTVNGKKYYSKWSGYKSVKTK